MMLLYEQLNGFLYVGDFLFIASLATIILKLKLENSSQGFSAKTQGVYGVVLCTRNIDLLFIEGSALYLTYTVLKKIANISCIIYIVFKIKSTTKNNTNCTCNQDSFWVEALVLPCMIITAIFHYSSSPEEVLWSFSTYLETVAMVPQLYLIHVRGKGDTYLFAYISLMATYSFIYALAYSLNCFMYEYADMSPVWPACKCIQLSIYLWYFFIPQEAVLPVANCAERKRRATVFMRQQSMLAQALLTKNNSSNDLQIFTLTSPKPSAPPSPCSSVHGSMVSALDNGTPPTTPCVKFDLGLEGESFRLKAPISLTTIKQLKNKGTLKLSSLPASPETKRKGNLTRCSSNIDIFRPKNEFTQFETALSQRAKRMRNTGVSLPSTPEQNRKFPCPSSDVLHRSISQIYLNRKEKKGQIGVSLPNSPESPRKRELILQPPTSYRSLSRLPPTHSKSHKLCPPRPPLPLIEGSPDFIKKSEDFTQPRLIESTLSPKPARPPQPDKLKIASTKTQLTCCKQEENHRKSQKPARPPLPKFVISSPDS